jgi:hypothetical protein
MLSFMRALHSAPPPEYADDSTVMGYTLNAMRQLERLPSAWSEEMGDIQKAAAMAAAGRLILNFEPTLSSRTEAHKLKYLPFFQIKNIYSDQVQHARRFNRLMAKVQAQHKQLTAAASQ